MLWGVLFSKETSMDSFTYILCFFFSEIVDGNLKMILGMIWTIILRFAIQDIAVEGKAWQISTVDNFLVCKSF